jgi:GntR family transcriptional regulator, transcriptional repressor for pyruvate dehydrogenase complex
MAIHTGSTPNTSTGGVSLAPEAKATALEAAVTRIEELVVDRLEPGMQLPSEATMADDLGVSRLTLREALKVLAGRGLIDQGRGRKATVRHPDSSLLSSQLSIAIRRDPRAVLELHEIRLSLEVLSAGRAARNPSSAALAAVEAALEKMSEAALSLDGSPTSVDRYNDADVGFHAALAMTSDNRMLASILESLSDSLHQSMALSFAGFLATRGDIQEAVASHKEIFELVRDGNVRGAEVAMRNHLQAAERDLRSALRE